MSKEEYPNAIEVSVIFHEGMKMFAVPVQPAPVQQEPEWYHFVWHGEDCFVPYEGQAPANATRLYTSPQAQPAQRKPLTDKEIVDAIQHLYQNRAVAEMAAKVGMDDYRAIEAAHNIKENT